MLLITDNYKKIILGLIFLIITINFFGQSHVPINDEYHSLITYSMLDTLFYRDTTNNHFINNFFAITLNNIYYLDIKILRFFSILLVFTSFIILFKIFKTEEAALLSFVIFLSSSNFFIFSFLFRGWPYFILLFALIFYLINNFEENDKNIKKNFKIIFIICSILTFSAPSNVYLTAPIILHMFVFYFKKFKKIPINFAVFYLALPFLILFFLLMLVNGIYEMRGEFGINYESYETSNKILLIFSLITKNIFSILENGFNVFFSNYNQPSKDASELINDLFIQDKILFTIYFILILNLLFTFLKKKKIGKYESILIIHLLLVFVLSKYNTIRLFIPFYVLYFLALDNIFVNLKLKKNKLNFLKFLVLIIFTFLFSFTQQFNLDNRITNNYYYSNIKIRDYIDHKKFLSEISNDHLKVCTNQIVTNDSVKKRMIYYYYLSSCKNKNTLIGKFTFFDN